jgi:hypothetical protein
MSGPRAQGGELGVRIVVLHPWDRRAKVPLGGLTWALLRSARRKRGAVVEARIDGEGREGGPACGTVPLVGSWRVIAR